MPPRIPLFQCLHAPKAANPTPHASFARSFTSSPPSRRANTTPVRKYRDPWAIAQARARKAANISRQEVLKKEHAEALGDPIRGVPTPYLESFDTATAPPLWSKQPEKDGAQINDSPSESSSAPADENLNFFLTKSELEAGLEYSQWLSRPPPRSSAMDLGDITDDKTPAEREAAIKDQQATAAEALTRIANLSLGSSKDRKRVNVKRIINDFGRHVTDTTLPPRPASAQQPPHNQLPKTPRVGPDTGSSEVQIAILTAKIRTLATFLETRGNQDKHNKRNLRLLVHRRAKLLNYLRRKERGGPRFQHLVNTLGLTEGTYKGEITLMGPLGGHSTWRLAKLQPPVPA